MASIRTALKGFQLMGLSSDFVDDFAALKERGALDGISSIIEIGAQQLSNALLRSTEATDGLFRLFGQKPHDLGTPNFQGMVYGLEHQPEDAPASRALWEALGFTYAALDFDGHRDSIAIDLNRDVVPRRLKGAFDLAVNTGTTEHVANQDNAFRVIHDLVRPGGIMMHEVPGPGIMAHGMISYNLQFFWLLCRENSYEVLYLKIYSHPAAAIPDNVLASNIQFSGQQHISPSEVPFFVIRAALRKVLDRPFVTPLDIPPIIKTEKPIGLFDRILKKFQSSS